MKVIEISNKVNLIRHWGRWYRVQRGAADWQPLKPFIKREVEKPARRVVDPLDRLSPEQAAEELARRIAP